MKNQVAKELKYYGLHACLAIWNKRPNDIIRVYVDPQNVKIFSPLLKWCASQKKAYHIIPSEEMIKVSDSIHHEGICILARELPVVSFDEMFRSLKSKECLLYLDGVQNPHNIGSILRTAAHFGIRFVLGMEGQLPALSSSACRIAKGAAEMVRLVSLNRPKRAISSLKKNGFSLIGTSSHRGQSLYRFSFPKRTIIALGSESSGVSDGCRAHSDFEIQIPGSGQIESLNVSVAASLCLGEYFRQHE